jgi:hypothetical protein
MESKDGKRTYTMALLTSPIGMTPSFSPSMGSENSANASLISASSRAVMLCSFASLDWRSLGAEGGTLRFGGYHDLIVSHSLSGLR